MTIYDCICIICICIHVHVQEFMPGRGTALLWAYCRRYVYIDIHIANELRQLRLGIYYTTNPVNYIYIYINNPINSWFRFTPLTSSLFAYHKP